jgi:hypothetical protein
MTPTTKRGKMNKMMGGGASPKGKMALASRKT